MTDEEVTLQEPKKSKEYTPVRPKQKVYSFNLSSFSLVDDEERPLRFTLRGSDLLSFDEIYAKEMFDALYWLLKDHYPEVFEE